MTDRAQAAFDQIRALSIPDQLRLAAELLEAKRADVAHPIIKRISLELGAALAWRRMDDR